MIHQKIVVGFSGGVDSAVAAGLLKAEGHEVIAIFMKNWQDENDPYCPANEDFVIAAAVADVLDIELQFIDFSKEYYQQVFESFLQDLKNGLTPNPDVLCNAHIKFTAFLEHALNLGADLIATGHYVGRRLQDEWVVLSEALDSTKDQSYFLYRLNQSQLKKSIFPLEKYTKKQVRQLAQTWKLPNAAKKDSTGICFIGERPFKEFVNRFIPSNPGDMVDERGRVLGRHDGLAFYTLGQRKGLGVGGTAFSEPDSAWYVASKNLSDNTLLLVQGREHPLLWHKMVQVLDCSWISGLAPKADPSMSYRAKTRYRQVAHECQIDLESPTSAILTFDQPQWAVTPGQSAVLYSGDVCLGGGIIQS
ncbi:MAG: tRNA 2-thiouridine(34) synthase MnmA [Gammaproteobacteria bacterium]|nr:tRNA 2-thiouridine(34) synthase MnmA [Gammaproteobacteria bacterium]